MRTTRKGIESRHRETKKSLAAKIFAVAEVIDALLPRRHYRQSFTLELEKALHEISQNKGKRYDFNVVYAGLSVFCQRNLPLGMSAIQIQNRSEKFS